MPSEAGVIGKVNKQLRRARVGSSRSETRLPRLLLLNHGSSWMVAVFQTLFTAGSALSQTGQIVQDNSKEWPRFVK